MEKEEKKNDNDAKILIIDDEIQILEMLKRIIEFKGYKSITAPSAIDALGILRTHDIKLALLDINMPEMSGVELLKQIQKISPSTNVIMMTGYKDMETAEKCMQIGAKDYITKPFDIEYLETSVLSQIIPYV